MFVAPHSAGCATNSMGDDVNDFKKIDKGIYGTLKEANWGNRKIIVVLKNLNKSKDYRSEFKEFLTKLKTFHVQTLIISLD
ncbi:kinase-like domain-containing protein [Rhizophagus clarus]|uniref:Kinase-like domain-containing protein n=1 Tax=Rhizophagus clarus TaxID=94130 RepID=A0A8H3QD14_9GLOM|nr:kinase-like domain-containing protein [Rhizophagus clarus]